MDPTSIESTLPAQTDRKSAAPLTEAELKEQEEERKHLLEMTFHCEQHQNSVRMSDAQVESLSHYVYGPRRAQIRQYWWWVCLLCLWFVVLVFIFRLGVIMYTAFSCSRPYHHSETEYYPCRS